MPLAEADRLLVAQYLDGSLPDDAIHAFEQRARSDAELRNEVVAQQAITQSLRRMFAPATMHHDQVLRTIGLADVPADHVTQDHPDAVSGTVASKQIADRVSSHPLRRLAIAAVLIGGLFGVWLAWPQFTITTEPAPQPIAPRVLTAAAAYRTEIDSGFEPDWVCANDEEFIATFRDRLGQGLVMKPATARAHMLGLDYAKVLSPLTITMLGRVDDQPVLVIIDRLSQDKPDAVNTDLGELNAFRREVGSLVLYEITPLNEPLMLDLIGRPDA